MTTEWTIKTPTDEKYSFSQPRDVQKALVDFGCAKPTQKELLRSKQLYRKDADGQSYRVTRRKSQDDAQGSATRHSPPRRNGKVQHPDDWVIRLLVAENPKRPGSKSHALFEQYKDGMTVADYIAQERCDRACLRYDEWKGFIRVEAPKQEAEQAE